MPAYITKNPPKLVEELATQKQALVWATALERCEDYIYETNKFLKEYQKPWGYNPDRPGLNSGDGKTVARIPHKLLYILLAKDPDLLENDVKWNKLMREHPNWDMTRG